jgi:hypothetical protein
MRGLQRLSDDWAYAPRCATSAPGLAGAPSNQLRSSLHALALAGWTGFPRSTPVECLALHGERCHSAAPQVPQRRDGGGRSRREIQERRVLRIRQATAWSSPCVPLEYPLSTPAEGSGRMLANIARLSISTFCLQRFRQIRLLGATWCVPIDGPISFLSRCGAHRRWWHWH